MNIRCARLLILAVGAGALALPAVGQQLEEIVVTATKREESLQEVPLAITTVDGVLLTDYSISNFYDMNIPGVNIAQGGMNDNAFIRGVGQSSGNFGFENSAPFYIDGVYWGRARGTRIAYLDVERLEVLKGPQPTYLGKNATAGAINVTSRRPGDEFEGHIDLYQEFQHDETVLTAAVGGPLSDTFGVRAAAKVRRLDGWVNNMANGRKEPTQEDELARISAVWNPADNVEVYAKLETMNVFWEGRNTQTINCSPAWEAVIDPNLEDCIFNETRSSWADPANHPDNFFIRVGELFVTAGDNNFYDFEMTSTMLGIDWDLDAFTVNSITGYYDFTNMFFADPSHSETDFGVANFVEEYDQFSQELRFTSNADGPLSWLAGVYMDSNNNVNFTRNSIFPNGPMAMLVIRDNDEDGDSWAAFGEVEFQAGDAVNLKLAGRYTEVDKVNVYTQDWRVMVVATRPWMDNPQNAPMTFTRNQQYTESAFQPSITAEWFPDDTRMLYASYKKGFKAGANNHQPGVPALDRPIDAEDVVAYELGAKTTLADGAARLNLALFRSEIDNLQVATFDAEALTFVTQNAGSALSQGLEADFDWAATENLTVSAYLSLLDANFDVFTTGACYPFQTEAEGCINRIQDQSGTPLQFAPDLSGTIGLNHNRPLQNGLEFFWRADVFFTTEYVINSNADPNTYQDSYAMLDGRIGVGDGGGRWRVALVGRNLNNVFVKEWNASNPLAGNLAHFALLKRPRQLALQGQWYF